MKILFLVNFRRYVDHFTQSHYYFRKDYKLETKTNKQTVVINITRQRMLQIFSFMNLTFRMLQQTSSEVTPSVYRHLLFHCHDFPNLVLVFVFQFNCSLGNRYF